MNMRVEQQSNMKKKTPKLIVLVNSKTHRLINIFRIVSENVKFGNVAVVCPEKVSSIVGEAARYFFDECELVCYNGLSDDGSPSIESDLDVEWEDSTVVLTSEATDVNGDIESFVFACGSDSRYICLDKYWDLGLIELNTITYTARCVVRMVYLLQKKLASRVGVRA